MKYLKYRIITGFVLAGLIFTACEKDFLERTPLDAITSADFFLHANDLELYMNQFYDDDIFELRREVWGISGHSLYGDDNFGDNQLHVTVINPVLAGTRTVDYTQGNSWNFEHLREINYFFENYKKCQDPFDDYKQYVGEAHFFRALQYFYFLQAFGDVPWHSTTLGTTSPELYAPRDPRNFVADKILADLDTASMYLSEDKTNGYTRINKWMALLLQSEVALYEGTWEKYHDGDPFGVSSPQPEKYLNKAVEAASAVMNSGLYDIWSTGAPESDYLEFFRQRDYSDNSEVLFWKKSIASLDVTVAVSITRRYPAQKSLTKSLADYYLCIDGKPIAGNPLFGGYNSLVDEAQNRDPRFTQTIAMPDQIQLIEENGTLHYWSEVYAKLNSGANFNAGTGYINNKGYDPHAEYQSYFEEQPVIYMRYAEALLNFAEAKAELGTLTQADIDISIKKLRDRVGMPNLELANITTDPNWNFPDLSPLINEIRRERRIELATEGYRWQDIARWAAADELIVGKRPKGFRADQLVFSTTFPVDENGFLDPFQNTFPNGYGFVLDRDYLCPVPQHQIVLNPNLTQNPGWPAL